MFDASATDAGAAGVSLDEVERRAGLARDAGPLGIQDQLDWAETLLAAGDRASARLLIEGAAIQQGFSPQLEDARADLFAAVGLERPRPARQAPRGNTVDIALADLRGFAQTHGAAITAGAAASVRRIEGKPGLHPTAKLARAASAPSRDSVGALVHQAFAWLRPDSAGQDEDSGVAAVDALRGSDKDPRRLTAQGLAGAASPVLASAIAAQAIRAFLRAHSDLLLPRLGSPALFRAAAAFESTGLGPYFGNVGQIARTSANLFELAAIAAEAGGTGGDPIVEQAWVALLSRGLSGWLRVDLIDELGDRNASFALTVILERTVAVAADDIDRSLVARIRDAGLDNLDYDLAAAAQQALVNLDPGSMLERQIMGAIHASAGRIAVADQLLSACLDRNPGDRQLREEVLANRERRYAPFALTRGYGSPRDRQLTRLAARTA